MDTKEFTHAGIMVKQNPLTGDWFVYPPNGGLPFILASKLAAKRLIDRINRGEKV